MNRSRPHPVLAIAVGMLCTLAVGACGTSSSDKPSATARLLDETFKATSSALHSARLDARLQLEPEGLLAIGGPIALDLRGPVLRPGRHGPARLKLAAVATVAGQRYRGGLLADGRHAYLQLDAKSYRLADNGPRKALASLSLDPRGWIKDEQTKGHRRIAGTDTIHVTGTVDAKRLAADLGSLVPAKLGSQIAAAVTSADFELWTGARDKIVRQFALRASFAFAKGAPPPIPGLEAGRIQLRARLDDVNGRSPAIRAPGRSLALSKVPTERGLGGLVHCLGKGGGSGAGIAGCVAGLAP